MIGNLPGAEAPNYGAFPADDVEQERVQQEAKTCCGILRTCFADLCHLKCCPTTKTTLTLLTAVGVGIGIGIGVGYGLFSNKTSSTTNGGCGHDQEAAIGTMIGYLQFLSSSAQDLAYCIKNNISTECAQTSYKEFADISPQLLNQLSGNFTKFLTDFYEATQQ